MRKIASNGSEAGRFVDNKVGRDGTVLSAEWLNTVQDELVAVATMDGSPLLEGKNDQVKSAIISLVSAAEARSRGYFQNESNTLRSLISTTQTKADASETRLNHRVGEIVTTLSNTPPPDCLPCNGAAYEKSNYPKLIAYVNEHGLWATTPTDGAGSWGKFIHVNYDPKDSYFLVPNLSGMFLRMAGGNAGTLGNYQGDEIREHRHLEGAHVEFGTGNNITNQGARNTGSDSGGRRYYTGLTGGTETRPHNVAVNFWVRYQ